MEIWSRLFHLTYGTQHRSNEHIQASENYFHQFDLDSRVMMGRISRTKLIAFQLMSQFDLYQFQLVYLTMEHCLVSEISSTKLHKSLSICSISHSIFHKQKPFCISHFFKYKHNMLKMLLFVSSSTL